VLDTGDASAFLSTLPGRRSKEITLVALANLSKYQGRYERFQELKKCYDLKWSTSNSTQYFERFFNEELTLDIMLQRIRQMIAVLPPFMGKIVKFACLVGLRASETIESVRLICSDTNRFYNADRQTLEHFRFPSVFLRQTKKAYLSFVTPEIIGNMKKIHISDVPTLNAITLACRRKGIKMEMYLCRKIFASWLRNEGGIQPEVVDMLQGRVSPSVLTRHYLVPRSSLKEQVLQALEQLQRQL
jgi:hypothetical protein